MSKRKRRIIVAVTNDLFTDQRVHKVCTFLEQLGWDVLLVGRKLKHSQPIQRSYATHRMKLFFTKGALFYAFFNLRLFFFLLVRPCEAILSNDLDTLLACYCAKRFKKKCDIIYDSHELFTEVPELVSRPRVQKIWLWIEQAIFPKLKKVYTVNNSIAAIYRGKYMVNVRVVRNVSPIWKPQIIRSREELNLPNDRFIIVLQGAGINIDRGAEEAMEAMKYIQSDALFLIIGDGDVIPQLKEKVQLENLEKSVKFLGKMSYQEMMNYTHHADLGLSLDKSTNSNYLFSLPNKIFDYIHTSTPILASDLIEVKKVVEQHNVGRIVSSHNPKEIASHIDAILGDKLLLESLKNNCKEAAKVENWEQEIVKVLDYFD